MNLLIKPHSSVDIITNSSTVIYTCVANLGIVYDIIDEVLKIAGNQNMAQDLFEVREIPNLSLICDNLSEEEIKENYPTLLEASKLPYGEQTKALQQVVIDNPDVDFMKMAEDHSEYGQVESGLLITRKDNNEDTGIGKMLEQIFTSDGSYDG